MSSIIFIGSPEKTSEQSASSLRDMFFVNASDIAFRIFASFIPPLSKRYRRVYVDFLGPIFGVLLLAGVINYGYNMKNAKVGFGPNEFLSWYIIAVPICFYLLSKLGQSNINISEILSLVGYSLYGHLATLVVSYLCFHEDSNAFFFICLIIFCGLSTLRLALVFLKTIPRPGLRLIVCSTLSIIQILSLVYIHFAYMHRTYVYGKKHIQIEENSYSYD